MWNKKIKIFSSYKPKVSMPNLFSKCGSDLCLNIKAALIPVHRAKLLECAMIQKRVEASPRILIIYEDLDINMAYSVIGYYYGYDIELSSNLELENLLKVVQIFQAQKLNLKVSQILLLHKQKFELFYLLQLAYKFNLKELIQQCLRQLEKQQFEQFNYNKFQLLECDFYLFQILIRRHHRLKIENKIIGIATEIIKQIIQIYCRRNYLCEKIKYKLFQKYIDPWNYSQQQIQAKMFCFQQQLPCKNIQSSYNGNSSGRKQKQELSTTSPSMRDLNSNRKKSNFYKRKYSIEVEKALEQFGYTNKLKQKFTKSGWMRSQNLIKNQPLEFLCNFQLNKESSSINKQAQQVERKLDSQKESILQIKDNMQIFEIQKKVNFYCQEIQQSSNCVFKLEMKNTRSMIFEEALEEDIQISNQCIENNMARVNKRIIDSKIPYNIFN